MKNKNLIIVLTILVILAGGNMYLYFQKQDTSLSGFSISDFSSKIKQADFDTIFFITQWFFILLIIIFFYIKFLRHKRKEKEQEKEVFTPKRKTKGAETDLDVFYEMLKNKKNMKLSLISESFKINSETALEWGKILENSNLAKIDYPAFSEPVIKIISTEKEEKEEKEKHEKEVEKRDEKENKEK